MLFRKAYIVFQALRYYINIFTTCSESDVLSYIRNILPIRPQAQNNQSINSARHNHCGTKKKWSHLLCLFVCLFGFFRPTREFFTHMETSPAGEGLQIFTFDRHSWPLSSEGSLTCHTYCDTGHPLLMVTSEDP